MITKKTLLSGVAHTLDAAGRRLSATYEDNLGQAYAYDPANQVTHSRVNIANAATASATTSPTHTYGYDKAGNRTSSLAFGQSTAYSANNVNAYTTISGGGFVAPSPTFDPKGNTLTLPRSNGTSQTLTWDAHDRLRSVTPSGSTASTMVYDPLGRLVWSRRPNGANPATDEVWSWSSWTLLAREIYQASTLLETYRYTWGPDLSGTLEGAGGVGGLLAVERAVGSSTTWDIRHTHADANGNILALTTSTGQVSARYRYSPFGETLTSLDLDSSGWATRNIHRFSTKPEVAGMGLLYYGYRYYDPQTGRWPSRDPIEEKGGVNLYGFVGNDGLSKIDLLGMVDIWDFLKIPPWLLPITGYLDLANECDVPSTKTEPEKDVKCRVWCSKGQNQGGHFETGTADVDWKYKCEAAPGSIANKGGWMADGSEVKRDCDAKCEDCYTTGEVEWW